MSTKPKFMIAERLKAAHLTIANSLAEAEIQSLVTKFGYPAEELQKGMALYDQALAASNEQTTADGAQQLATKSSYAAEVAARDAYQALAKVARALYLSDRPRLVALGLHGSEPNTTAGFLGAALALFNNAAAMDSLAAHGYDAAELEAQRGLIKAFELADEKQEAAKGIAQQATQTRDEAVAKLDAWRAQYIKIARVALRGQPQLLERIGVPARTSKTAAQRNAAKKKVAVPSA